MQCIQMACPGNTVRPVNFVEGSAQNKGFSPQNHIKLLILHRKAIMINLQLWVATVETEMEKLN